MFVLSSRLFLGKVEGRLQCGRRGMRGLQRQGRIVTVYRSKPRVLVGWVRTPWKNRTTNIVYVITCLKSSGANIQYDGETNRRLSDRLGTSASSSTNPLGIISIYPDTTQVTWKPLQSKNASTLSTTIDRIYRSLRHKEQRA